MRPGINPENICGKRSIRDLANPLDALPRR